MAIEMECLCVLIRMEDTLIYILALMKINRIVVYLVNFREEKSFYRYVLLQIFYLFNMLALLLPLVTKGLV